MTYTFTVKDTDRGAVVLVDKDPFKAPKPSDAAAAARMICDLFKAEVAPQERTE